MEAIALCIVSCQKDKMVLGANKGPLRPAAFSLKGSFPLPLPSLLQLVVGVKHEGHGDAFRNAIRHTSANTQKTSGTLCCSEPLALQRMTNVVP